MATTPKLKFGVEVTGKQLDDLMKDIKTLANNVRKSSTNINNSTAEIKQSLNSLKSTSKTVAGVVNKNFATIQTSITRVADHTTKQLTKIANASVTAHNRMGAAAERNLNKVAASYDKALKSARAADASISASAKQIKKNAEDMMKGTAKFGGKLASALKTIEDKLEQVLKGIQAMSRSAATAAKNATKAIEQNEKALKQQGRTLRSETESQKKLYKSYSKGIEALFITPKGQQQSLANLITQRRAFNTLLRQTAVNKGIPQQFQSKGKYEKDEKPPRLPFGKIDDTGLRQWGRGEEVVFKQALKDADMLKLKWGQLRGPLDALSTKMMNTGRNMRWMGQNLLMTFSVPMFMAARKTTQLYLSVAQEFTRIQKVAGLNVNAKNAEKQARDLKTFQRIKADISTGVSRYGISQKSQAALFGDIVAMGYSADKAAESIRGMTTEAGQMADEIMRTATLGDIGIKTATDFYRTMLKVFVSAQPGVKTFADTIQGTNFIVDQLNQIENKTSINLNQLADAMPVAAGAAKLFGMKAAELASILTGLYDKGIAVNTAATGINFSLTRILAPTKKAAIVFDDAFGAGALRGVQNIGGGMERLIVLSEMYRKLLETQGKVKVTQVFSELVSKRQIKTFEPLVSSINEGTDQVRNALLAIPEAVKMASDKNIDIGNRDTPFYDLVPIMSKFKKELLSGADGAEGVTNGYIRALIAANGWATTTTDNVKDLAKELQKLSAREIDIKLKSDPIRYQIMLQTIKMLGAEIGQFLFPMLIKVTGVVKRLVEGLNNLAPSTKSLLAALAVALASFGPLAISIGSFRSVFGMVGKSIAFFLPKLQVMSKEALLLAVNMGRLNLATSTVAILGSDKAAVIEGTQSKLLKFFMRIRGAKLADIAITEAAIKAEQNKAAAIGQSITAEKAREKLQKEAITRSLITQPKPPMIKRILGRAGGIDPTTGKSYIGRGVLGMGGRKDVMPAGFVEGDSEYTKIRKRYDAIRAAATQYPLEESPAAMTRRGAFAALAESLGVKAPPSARVEVGKAAGRGRTRGGKRRARKVFRRMALSEYIPGSERARQEALQQIVPELEGVLGSSKNVKQRAKLSQVIEAARKGDYAPLESYYRTARPTTRAKIARAYQMIPPPTDLVSEPPAKAATVRGRLAQRLTRRKATRAMIADIAAGADVGTTAAVGGAGGAEMAKAVTKQTIKDQFKESKRVFMKEALGVAATPLTTVKDIVARPFKAVAMSKVIDAEGNRVRGRGLKNLRPVRAYQALFGRGADILDDKGKVISEKAGRGKIPRMLDKAAKTRQFIKDKGGLKAAMMTEEAIAKKDKIFSGMKQGLKLFTQFGIYTPIIIAIGAGIFLIAKNWDKVYKSMAPGIKAIKEAWNKLLDAFKGVGKIFGEAFSGLAGESKKGEEDITSPFDAVGQVLSSLLEVISALVEAIAALITKMAPVFRWLADIMKNSFGFLINLIKMIAKLLKGDFSEAWGYAKMAIGYFLKFVLSIYKPINSLMSAIGKIVLKTIGVILSALSHLPGRLGKAAARARNAVQRIAEGFDLTRMYENLIDKYLMTDVEIRATGVAGEEIYKPAKRSTDNKQVKEPDMSGDDGSDATQDAANKMANIWDNFLSTLKSKLDETINALKDTLNKSFEKVWEERLKVYDDQIKAIDDLEKKEEELLATQEYLQNRREALNKRSLDQQNYVRNRALAIYEGRIDDARMLDLEFSQTNASNNKAITDLDSARARDLLKKQRDIQRQQIQDAKSAAEELKKVQEENFKKQIDLITQYTPRTDAEWRAMMDQINNTIAAYGMPMITGSFMDGMQVFKTASDNAKNEIMASAFWSGEWIDTSILSWISQLSGIPLQNLVKAASDAGSTAGQAFTDGYNDSLPEDAPKVLTKKEKAVMNWNAALDWNQKVKDFNANPANQQELANAFQGWGPSISPTTPALTRPMTRAERRAQETGGLLGGRNATIGPLPSNTNVTTTGTTIPGRKKNTPKKDIDNEGYWAGVGRRGGKMIRGVGSAFSFVSHMFGPPKDQKEGTNKAVGNLMKSISNSIKSFGKELFKQDGADITRGINRGILDPRTQAEAKRSGVKTVDNIRDAARDHAKIKSPSRLFADEVGKPIIYGIIAGILDDKAVATLKESFENLLKPLLNVERKGKIYIDFDVTTGGIRSGIEQRLNEIFGTEIRFKTPRFLIDIDKIFKSLTAGVRAYVKFLDLGIGRPNNGPNVSMLEGYLGSPIPGLATGGIVKSRPGGIMANIGEGRYDEAIIPLPNGLKNFANSFQPAAASMGRFEGSMKTAMVSALKECAPYMGGEESGGVTIYVDNFIGQPQWFESMMTEYGVKVAPNKQRSYGTMNRKVTSYQDNAYRTGRI